jgi:hypothetical protein
MLGQLSRQHLDLESSERAIDAVGMYMVGCRG